MARVLPFAPAAVPTLDEIAADPERAAGLPPATLQALACRGVAALAVIHTAMIAASARAGDSPTEPDRLIDVVEAARRLGCSQDWVYRHAKQLPFATRTGRLLRFSSHGIDRFIKARAGRHA